MPIISHVNHEVDLNTIFKRLEASDSLTLPLEATKKLAVELLDFEFGRSLIANQGLDGYWTSYAISGALVSGDLKPLESWIIKEAPVLLATRERFHIFQDQAKRYLSEGMHVASLPCGVMDDLLTLDHSASQSLHYAGIDLDQKSLDLAKENAAKLGKMQVSFIQKDAWALGLNDEYNIMLSNGLNIYEPSSDRVIDFYKNCYDALKPGGRFITSFLTPPASMDADSPWTSFSKENLIKQQAIFKDIIQSRWMCFNTEDQTRQQLQAAGFEVEEVIYDSQRMFPTIIAKK